LNPFVLLRVSPCSTALQIKQAYEDALEEDVAPADVLQRAQQSLLTPKLRIDAEVGGLLDVHTELASQIVSKLRENVGREELDHEISSLHALPRSNTLAHLGTQSSLSPRALLQLLEAQSAISAGGVYDAVLEAREEAGAGKIDRQGVEEALRRLEDRQTKAVINSLAGERTFASKFSQFVKLVLARKDAPLIQKLDSYVLAYSNAAASELSARRESVVTACNHVRNHPTNERTVEQIPGALRRWNELGEPLQLFESYMHREDAQTRELYLYVRNLCIWLANEKGQFDTARQITRACADIFKELPRASEQIKEESAVLTQLHNQQIATTLDPLCKICEEVQQNRRCLEQEIIRSGFGPGSEGLVKKLYDAFAQAARVSSATDAADLPWRLLRAVAVSFHNDSNGAKAAAALNDGLIQFFDVCRPSAEVVALLQQDRQACKKTVIQGDIEKSLSSSDWGTACRQIEQLLELETDQKEIAAFRIMRGVVADRRRSSNLKLGLWIAAGVAFILVASANQGRPNYREIPIQWNVDSSNTNQERPPPESSSSFTRANILYCKFHGVCLEASRSIVSPQNVSAVDMLIEDRKSRCGRYRYRAVDKSATDAEVIVRGSAMEARKWSTGCVDPVSQ
jgi:hypothetical protein